MYPQPMGFMAMVAPPLPEGIMAQPCGSIPAAKAKAKAVPKKRIRDEPQSRRPKEDAEDEVSGRGVISLLQEFVQCSKNFPTPQHRPILQWTFDTHMADNTNLEFRAQVSFLLDGVPHHVAGAWQQSKKLAQRDTAERCLGLFVGCWGTYLLQTTESSDAAVDMQDDPVLALQKFCSSFRPCNGQGPTWCIDMEAGRCKATAEITLLGVRHSFAGSPAQHASEAKEDTAKRVLWYLQCPGYENLFEPDVQGVAAVAKEIPTPPSNWVNLSEDDESVQAAERKTAVMRLQNRLQQSFAKKLKPGQGVWEWSYETDASDENWPPLQRATVWVPVAHQSFTGPWKRGQREAQLEACQMLQGFLDSLERPEDALLSGTCQ